MINADILCRGKVSASCYGELLKFQSFVYSEIQKVWQHPTNPPPPQNQYFVLLMLLWPYFLCTKNINISTILQCAPNLFVLELRLH